MALAHALIEDILNFLGPVRLSAVAPRPLVAYVMAYRMLTPAEPQPTGTTPRR